MSSETQNTTGRFNAALAMTAGLGFTIMASVLGIGAIQGGAADSGSLGLFFAIGIALFFTGIAGWLFVNQPYRHFDDINVPKDTGHHHAETHEPAADAGHSAH